MVVRAEVKAGRLETAVGKVVVRAEVKAGRLVTAVGKVVVRAEVKAGRLEQCKSCFQLQKRNRHHRQCKTCFPLQNRNWQRMPYKRRFQNPSIYQLDNHILHYQLQTQNQKDRPCKRPFQNPSIYSHHRCEIPYYQTRQWGLFHQ